MNLRRSKNVFVGMSGGVDSSVAAFLLKKQGYNVVGVFMRSYNVDGCAERDAEDARRAAGQLQIPFYVWDFEEEYKEKVVQYMIQGYRDGLTPNPDVMCNREIKFGLFLNKALSMGADFVATGHYVRLKKGKINRLFEAKDKNKDQSYFLWTLTQKELKHSLFPIGNYLKTEVRSIARKAGLPTAEKKDSQGICFLGMVNVEDFLKQYIPPQKGQVLDTGGKIVGEHSGAEFYTIGQRHGFLINSKEILNADKMSPHYVVSKNIFSNTLVVAEGSENPALFTKEIFIKDVNFLSKSGVKQIWGRVRYRQPVFEAKMEAQKNKWLISFKKPQKFVAPGQSFVFYGKNGEMLGGGIIEKSV